jgi:signal recognition particle subunit SEC65
MHDIKDIDLILEEIKKYPEITNENMHDCLKKLNFQKYYEYSKILVHEAKNTKYPRISQEIKDGIIAMYINYMTQCTIKGIIPTISFRYIIYKYIELNGHDHLLEIFPKITKYDYKWNLVLNK